MVSTAFGPLKLAYQCPGESCGISIKFFHCSVHCVTPRPLLFPGLARVSVSTSRFGILNAIYCVLRRDGYIQTQKKSNDAPGHSISRGGVGGFEPRT